MKATIETCSSRIIWMTCVSIFVVVIVTIRLFIASPYVVPSDSMEPTIRKDSLVIGTKIANDPHEGDIVTVKDPDGSVFTFMKRVVAADGQTVDVHDGKLYVDGKLSKYQGQGQTEGDIKMTVPEGEIFIMGDNREHSYDSRKFGPVKRSDVVSVVRFNVFPDFGVVQ